METPIKIEVIDTDEDSLRIQFLGHSKDDEIEALPYRLLDPVLLKSTMSTTDFLSALTITFEDILMLKMYQMMFLLEDVINNIKTLGEIKNWNWDSISKAVNKTGKALNLNDVKKKTLILIDWLVKKDPALVKSWKSDEARRKYLGEVSEEEMEDNSQDEVITPVIKSEKDLDQDIEPTPSTSSACSEDVAGVKPAERFFHNGEELDLGDVLDTYNGDGAGASMRPRREKRRKVRHAETNESDDDEDYTPSDSDVQEEINDSDESEEVDDENDDVGDKDNDKIDDVDDDDDDESDEELNDDLVEESNKESDLTVWNQAVNRKKGQQIKFRESSENVVRMEYVPDNHNLGSTALTFSDLTVVEKGLLEVQVLRRLSAFSTVTTSLAEHEAKMNEWKEIADQVNSSTGGSRTPQELVSIYSKKLFLDHLSSKNCSIRSATSGGDKDGSTLSSSTKTAFKSLIAKQMTPSRTKSKNTAPKTVEKVPPPKPKDGFTEEMQSVFSEQIQKHKSVFQGLTYDRNRSQTLADVWKEIAEEVNAINFGKLVTVDELKKKWTMQLIQSTPATAMPKVGRPSGTPYFKHLYRKVDTEVVTRQPIKLEVDNAETSESNIVQILEPKEQRALITLLPNCNISSDMRKTVSFQLVDPTSSEASLVTLPVNCVHLKLLDEANHCNHLTKGNSHKFLPAHTKVMIDFLCERLAEITVTSPSVVALYFTQDDWNQLMEVVSNKGSCLESTNVCCLKRKLIETIRMIEMFLPYWKDPQNPTSKKLNSNLWQKGKRKYVAKEKDLLKPGYAAGDWVQVYQNHKSYNAIILEMQTKYDLANVYYQETHKTAWVLCSRDISQRKRCTVKLPWTSKK